MSEPVDPVARIAAALERLAPQPSISVDWLGNPAYIWDGADTRAHTSIDAPALADLRGIDTQKSAVQENMARLAKGFAAHDMLLWGARGMGKSALLRASVKSAQSDCGGKPGLVQVAADALGTLPQLFAILGKQRRQYVIFIDDLGFAEDDSVGPRRLRSWLEGGIESRPANTRLAVTSNRRAIIARRADEQETQAGGGALNPRDSIDDKLALADRFGLALGFHPCSKETYLEIVNGYASPLGLSFKENEALAWALARGQRSGRSAWQFVVELAGQAGKSL